MRYLCFVLLLVPQISIADEFLIPSKVTAVTLYPDGAAIKRSAAFSVPAGIHQLILPDLPQNISTKSLRVGAESLRLGSVTTRIMALPPVEIVAPEKITAATALVKEREADLLTAQDAVDRAQAVADAATAQIEYLKQLGLAPSDQTPDTFRAISRMIAEETLVARQATLTAQVEARNRSLAVTDAKDALEKAQQALAALRPVETDQMMVTIQVTADAATTGTLEVTYVVDDANWTPTYDFALSENDGSATLEIGRGALVSQRTRESWTDVALTLSTVRPAELTIPVHPWPDRREIFDPATFAPQMKSRSAGAMASDMAMPVMVEEARAEVSVDGLAVSYSYAQPFSLADGVDQGRIALDRISLPATVRALAIPLTSPTGFVTADFVNTTGEVLLPGYQSQFFLNNRFVGVNDFDLVPAGGSASISFGAIDGLLVTRQILDKATGDRGIIRRSNEQTEETKIEVKNTTGRSWSVRLLDRIPYSEQEDLVIDWSATPMPTAQDIDGKRGVLEWSFDIAPGASKAIDLSHDIVWPEGKMLR